MPYLFRFKHAVSTVVRYTSFGNVGGDGDVKVVDADLVLWVSEPEGGPVVLASSATLVTNQDARVQLISAVTDAAGVVLCGLGQRIDDGLRVSDDLALTRQGLATFGSLSGGRNPSDLLQFDLADTFDGGEPQRVDRLGSTLLVAGGELQTSDTSFRVNQDVSVADVDEAKSRVGVPSTSTGSTFAAAYHIVYDRVLICGLRNLAGTTNSKHNCGCCGDNGGNAAAKYGLGGYN